VAEVDLAGRSRERFLERDLDVVAQVAAARGTVAALLRTTAARRAEEHVEDVAEALAAERPETGIADPAVDAGVTEAVVVRALLGVREHFVGFVDLFEMRLGRDLVGRDVRMILAGQLTIGALDRVLVGVASDAENVVVVGRHYRISTPLRWSPSDCAVPEASAIRRP
jgi:hypothetical protein